jgi:hypothetical protein
MAAMLSRRAYPGMCVCFDCGDPSRNTEAHRLYKRSAKFKEKRRTRREIEEEVITMRQSSL